MRLQVALREKVPAHIGVGAAADMLVEFLAGEHPAFLAQQLLQGQQVQGVGFGQGAIEVEQQGVKHGQVQDKEEGGRW
jgi:hypothetical protein